MRCRINQRARSGPDGGGLLYRHRPCHLDSSLPKGSLTNRSDLNLFLGGNVLPLIATGVSTFYFTRHEIPGKFLFLMVLF